MDMAQTDHTDRPTAPIDKVTQPNVEAERTEDCPYCQNEVSVELGPYGAFGILEVDGDLWHETCVYQAHGWDYYTHQEAEEAGDVPWCSNSDRYFNLHKSREIELCGEVFEWDEWLCIDPVAGDHGYYNLPTRDALEPDQLEELRQMDPPESHHTSPGPFSWTRPDTGGPFPASHVLFGGFRPPQEWICPDCGELVDLGEAAEPGGPEVDLYKQCENCDSFDWLTRGGPITWDAKNGLDGLSPRERQTIFLKHLGNTDKEIADVMDVEPSTVREYVSRARAKAVRGKNLHEWVDATIGVNE